MGGREGGGYIYNFQAECDQEKCANFSSCCEREAERKVRDTQETTLSREKIGERLRALYYQKKKERDIEECGFYIYIYHAGGDSCVYTISS